jgi:hemoglobin
LAFSADEGIGRGSLRSIHMRETGQSIYEMVGGQETFDRLVDDFYARVETDAVLRPVYPESLDAARQKLALFLAQFFGGPDGYSQRRGHPRLRARHLEFSIGKAERDVWLGHMLAALDATGIQEPARTQMRDYFRDASAFLINQD